MTPHTIDVAVIGGGAAGSSAALTLARARRSVTLIDAGRPRNAPAEGVHGFLTRDGISPTELVSIGHAEVEFYGGRIVRADALAARRVSDVFEVDLSDGTTVTARRLVVATGSVDELPDIPGLREGWGRSVIHCPYCHGWEVRDQPIGVIGSSAFAVHQALMFRQWSDDITLFLHSAPEPSAEELEQLDARAIRIVHGAIDSVEKAHVTIGSDTYECEALVVAPNGHARSDVLSDLGLRPAAHPMGMGEQIESDAFGLTAVPGVWVAGNVTELAATVVVSAAAGVMAGAAANADLIAEDTRLAVEKARHSVDFSNHFTAEFWNERYSGGSIWSGNPNVRLVENVSDLRPGTALDVGCGEGADAIWLAQRGWSVTGIDVSTVGLARAAEHAEQAGVDGIVWEQADAVEWDPAPRRFDLISAQFAHLPRDIQHSLHRRLAAAINPGGTLLIVGHAHSDVHTEMNRPDLPDMFLTAEEMASVLDHREWEIVTSTPSREAPTPDGKMITIHDAIMRATRKN
ncbi:FAD-dependent oxidoreductase [Actinomycetes bacterium M1A6_2h]